MGHDGIWWDTQLAWYHIVGIAKGNLLAIWVGRSSNWCVLLEGWLALLPVREDYGGKCGSSLSNIFFFGVVSLSFVVFLFSVVSCCWLVGIVFFKPLVAKLLQYPSSGLMRACGHFGVMSFCIFLLKTCPRFRMTAFIFVLSFLLGAWIFFENWSLPLHLPLCSNRSDCLWPPPHLHKMIQHHDQVRKTHVFDSFSDVSYSYCFVIAIVSLALSLTSILFSFYSIYFVFAIHGGSSHLVTG